MKMRILMAIVLLGLLLIGVNGCATSVPADTGETAAVDEQNSVPVPQISPVAPEYCLERVCVLSSRAGHTRRSRSTVRARSRAAWQGLAGDPGLEDLLPGYEQYLEQELDFDRDAIVAVFAGERSTGGYSLELDRVERSETTITLHIRENTPAADAMVTQALTYPALVVVIHDAPAEILIEY